MKIGYAAKPMGIMPNCVVWPSSDFFLLRWLGLEVKARDASSPLPTCFYNKKKKNVGKMHRNQRLILGELLFYFVLTEVYKFLFR